MRTPQLEGCRSVLAYVLYWMHGVKGLKWRANTESHIKQNTTRYYALDKKLHQRHLGHIPVLKRSLLTCGNDEHHQH